MSDFPTDWTTEYPDFGIDFGIPDWTTEYPDFGIDFGGGGGTTGGNTDFWNQGLGGNILGGLTDFAIAGLNTGMGINYMNQAQQAAQVQAEKAAQAIRKGNIWSVGAETAANYDEYKKQEKAKLFNIAHLNDSNVLWDQERTMLRNAAIAGLKPQDAAYYAIIT